MNLFSLRHLLYGQAQLSSAGAGRVDAYVEGTLLHRMRKGFAAAEGVRRRVAKVRRPGPAARAPQGVTGQ